MTSASSAALLAMLEAIGLPAGEVAAPLDAPDQGDGSIDPLPLRSSYGEARVDHAVANRHAAVAAHLISQRVADVGPGVEVGVRLWQLRDRTLLVVTGAAGSRRADASLREAVQAAFGDVAASLDVREVEDIVDRVGREYRTRARTPGGLVEQVGRVTAASLAAYLDGLGTSVVVELLP